MIRSTAWSLLLLIALCGETSHRAAAQPTAQGHSAPPLITVGGQVLTSDPFPTGLADAAVRLWAGKVLRHQTVSDHQGFFRLMAPEAGMYRLEVEAPGHVLVEYPLSPLLANTEVPPVTLSGSTEMIVVAQLDGRRVQGIPILGRAFRTGQNPRLGWNPLSIQELSDARGLARIPRPANEALEILAFRPGTTEAFIGPVSGRGVVLPVDPSREREVTVLTKGQPTEGAAVFYGRGAWSLGVTDAAGQIMVPSAVSDTHPLRIQGPGGCAVINRPMDQGGTLELIPPDRRIGRIVSGHNDQPVTHAWVWTPADPSTAVQTDEDGYFQWLDTSCTASGDSLRVAAKGFLTQSISGTSTTLQPEATVVGRVLDAGGQGLAQVSVEGPQGAWTRSDAQGRFTLRGLAGGSVRLRALRAGFVGAMAEVDLPPGGTATQDFVLLPGLLGHGRVLDTEESPIPEALVWLRDAQGQDLPTVRSNAEGVFLVNDITPGTYSLHVQGDGFMSLAVPGLELTAEGASVLDLGTLVLSPGQRLVGRVVDPSLEPVDGASVELRGPTDTVLARLRSDGNGFFETGSLPQTRIRLRAEAPGFSSVVMELQPPFDRELEVLLRPGAALSGQVVDADQRPVNGARVILEPTEESAGRRAWTASDADGSFELVDLTPGTYAPTVEADGFPPLEGETLEILAGERRDGWVLGWVDTAAVTGILVSGADDQPVGGGRVTFEAVGIRAQTTSDSAGRFQLRSLPEVKGRLTIRHPEFVDHRSTVTPQNPSWDGEIRLRRGLGLGIAATDLQDSPVAGVTLTLSRAGDRGHQATTDSEGLARFVALDRGDYRLSVHNSHWLLVDGPKEVRLEDTTTPGVINIQLNPGQRIEGRLLGFDFEDLADLEISAHLGADRRLGQVGHDFAFEVTGLRPGRWLLAASHPRGRRAQDWVEILAGDGVVQADLEATDGAYLEGSVTFDGQPVADARVLGEGVELIGGFEVGTDDSGRFEVQDVEPGAYRLRAKTPMGEARATVRVGTDPWVDLEVSAFTVGGRVADAESGDPLGDVTVIHVESRRRVSTNSSGYFELDGLWEGDHGLTIQHPGYATLRRTVTVPTAETLRMDLEQSLDSRLRVVDAHQRPTRNVQVVLLDPPDRVVHTAGGDDGNQLLLRGAPEGRWRMLVSALGEPSVEQWVQLPDEGLSVVLPLGSSLEVSIPELEAEVADVALRRPSGEPYRVPLGNGVRTSWALVAGHLLIDPVPVGPWILEVRTADQRLWQEAFTLNPGEPLRILPNQIP